MPEIRHYVCDLCDADSESYKGYMHISVRTSPIIDRYAHEKKYEALVCPVCAEGLNVPKETTIEHIRAFLRRITDLIR